MVIYRLKGWFLSSKRCSRLIAVFIENTYTNFKQLQYQVESRIALGNEKNQVLRCYEVVSIFILDFRLRAQESVENTEKRFLDIISYTVTYF